MHLILRIVLFLKELLIVLNKERVLKKSFPFYKQPDSKDCGPTCLRIIAKNYGKLISLQDIRDLSETTRAGSNLMMLSDAAEAIGGCKVGF